MTSWTRTIRLFLSSQVVSLFGSMLVQYALLWHITMTTQSGMAMTWAALAGFLPMFLLTPLGGVWADRFDRRLLIVGADLLVAASTFVLLVALLLGHQQLWLLLVIMGVRAVGQGIQNPAVNAILPQIVPMAELPKINGLYQSLMATTGLLAPIAAGAILSVAPMQWVLLIDIVTAAIAVAIMLGLVRVPKHERATAELTTSPWQDMRDGVRYVIRHPFIGRLYWYFAVTFVLAAPVSFLTPLQVTRTFSNDVWRLTVIEVAFGLGMTIGGVAAGRLLANRSRITFVGIALAVLGLMTCALGVPVNFVVYNLWMFLTGLFLPSMNVGTVTLLQESVEPAYMGRVFSVMSMISTSTMPAAMLFFGPLADKVSVETILLITGAFMTIGGLLMLADRTLRRGEASVAAAKAEGATPA